MLYSLDYRFQMIMMMMMMKWMVLAGTVISIADLREIIETPTLKIATATRAWHQYWHISNIPQSIKPHHIHLTQFILPLLLRGILGIHRRIHQDRQYHIHHQHEHIHHQHRHHRQTLMAMKYLVRAVGHIF
jgi:hypothetical protein